MLILKKIYIVNISMTIKTLPDIVIVEMALIFGPPSCFL